MSTCKCGLIKIGMKITKHRNWNPDCPHHGLDSEWWSSPEQVEKRSVDNEELRALQARARQARQQTKGES